MNIREKINVRFDLLEKQLEADDHLKSDEGAATVLESISSVAKFTPILSSAERDFINAAKFAVSEKKRWV